MQLHGEAARQRNNLLLVAEEERNPLNPTVLLVSVNVGGTKENDEALLWILYCLHGVLILGKFCE